MNYCDIGTSRIAYKVMGKGPVRIVVESALNSCNAEWWDFWQDDLDVGILLYDRPGYGLSSQSSLARTPENIAKELEVFLNALNITKKIILIGHSQGGLYATQFTLRNPSRVEKLILLDPLSFTDNLFRTKLTKEEFEVSGVDKSASLKLAKMLTRFGLGFLFKGLLKKAPPFCYHNYDSEATSYILTALTSHKQYAAALEEYRLSHIDSNLQNFVDSVGTLDVEVILITHDSENCIREIEYYGNTSRETALKVENIWQEIMGDMGKISKKTRRVRAENSSHYIHLTDRDLVISEVKEIV
jgi:pimeloyl-ACP methyl ester carboxylesterase